MASLQVTADSIRTAVSSTSTCTLATVTILSDLLLPKLNAPISSLNITKKVTKVAATSKTKTAKAAPAKTRGKRVVVHQENTQEHGEQLSPKERSILATEVINATLKSLTDAIKAPAQPPIRRQASKDLVKVSARKTLRRSSSLPQSPLQPRSLNRVSSSPSISTRNSRSLSSVSLNSSGHRSTGECARVAFACLRTLQASKSLKTDLLALQLENGMSVLIGKLLSLGLDDLAIKEVRILKRRLDPEETPKKGPSKADVSTIPQTLPELLAFGTGSLTGAKSGLVIATQLHILRLIASTRKYRNTESALPILSPQHSSSPTRLLLMIAKESKDVKQRDKVARQLQTLSEVLLSLCPSVSVSDDALAAEPRLSVAPDVAIQLQTLALHNRIMWWNIAGHKGDSAKELLEPFFRCLSAFARRSQCGSQETYRISSTAFGDLQTVLSNCTDYKHNEPISTLSGIYRLLGSLSKEANLVDDAIGWMEQVRMLLDPKADSDARSCSVMARLVALNLRRQSRNPKEEELLLNLLEGLERPFKGESSEIDGLIVEVAYARRAANAILARQRTSQNDELSDGLREMCESLIFLCPRLSLRYLGSPPDANSATKDIIRHDQRRQLITISALHSIDSALFLVKVLYSEGRLTWELLDSKLQDCLLLHDQLDVTSRGVLMEDGSPPPSYYVRISNLYYSQFLNTQRNSENQKDGQQIRALRRAIDCMRPRPPKEKKAALLSMKLERMAEFCKTTGRYDELFRTLLSLRDSMIDDGILAAVAESADFQPMRSAWMQNEDASVLARTIHSLLKVQLKYRNTSGQTSIVDAAWTQEEKGAVLEHQLEMLSNQASNAAANLLTKVYQDLLSVYNRFNYPIRRLRVLIHLLSLDHDQGADAVGDPIEDLKLYISGQVLVDGTGDEGLRSYLPHFKSLAMTIMELRQDQPDIGVLKQAIGSWSSMAEKCTDIASLERKIEDVQGLLTHLQSIADFMQVKGFETIRLAVLRLITDFSQTLNDSSNPDALVSSFTTLGSQWLQLGYSGKAGMVFDKAKGYNHENGVSLHASLQLHISYSEYLVAIGNYDKSDEQLAIAQALYLQDKEHTASRLSSTLEWKTRRNCLFSNAYLVYSMLALERGAAQTALNFAKQSIRLLRRAWTNIEEQSRNTIATPDALALGDTEKPSEGISQMSVTDIAVPLNAATHQEVCGSNFWPVITPLFRALNYLSGLYAHHGLFQETLYYAEQAHKLARQVGSEAHIAMASALLGSTWLKSGNLEKGSEYLMQAKQASLPGVLSRDTAILAYQLGSMHGLLGDQKAEILAYGHAEDILKDLAKADYIESIDRIIDHSQTLEDKMSELAITKRKAPVTRKAATRPRVNIGRKTKARAQTPVEVVLPIVEECPQLNSLKATILRQKARALMSMKRSLEALDLLHEAKSYTVSQIDTVNQGLAMAKQLLLQSIEQMNADPVYSVLQDSTISFPSVVGLSKPDKIGDRLSIARTSPGKMKAPRNGYDRARSKSPTPNSFFDKLRQAQEHLTEVYSIATLVAPLTVTHSISALLNSVAILLSTSGHTRSKPLAHPGYASCSVETTRTLAIRRQRKALQADSSATLRLESNSWPVLASPDSRRSSVSFTSDISRFQRDYIDIIPKSWTAISISLSDSRNELSITKIQAGYNPFILRLPLGRHNSMDADEDVFGFEQGQAELLEIIELANESAHDARDMTYRDAKTAWWDEREALDARLRDLLENIEKVWLGGFTGIFSQHARRPELLARFQKSFQNILDKHLPSRRKTGRRTANQRITLESRILDLFIGLGDASDEDCDFSEPLTDLLYFVVDVLQFHGELNAYAEIDFDSIVVETQVALRGYHAAIRTLSNSDEGKHTVLILDKALHSFPWESLPCMDGLAVSRLPSLGCLRDRILEQQKDSPEDGPEGRYINRDNGSYILNPSGDLKNTQATFQKSLQNLNNWDGIIKREPTEEEIKSSLESKDVFLYFGHGSGAQYIRAREIRNLGKCAVTWLMGCSSGALNEVGEFEPYGPPISYMHAGCPALVATLWDVTDKDIDRFAKTTFENWGLFEREVVGKGKGKGRKRAVADDKEISLVEAVAKGREACNLRYLNAAAVCVYGVPVYFR